MALTATYSARFRQLEYWTSRNTTTFAACYSITQARKIVALTGIAQRILTA